LPAKNIKVQLLTPRVQTDPMRHKIQHHTYTDRQYDANSRLQYTM